MAASFASSLVLQASILDLLGRPPLSHCVSSVRMKPSSADPEVAIRTSTPAGTVLEAVVEAVGFLPSRNIFFSQLLIISRVQLPRRLGQLST